MSLIVKEQQKQQFPKKMKKADCILGLVNKNGSGKKKIDDDYDINGDINSTHCLIFGHKPCLLDSIISPLQPFRYIKKLPETTKIKLKEMNTKIYKKTIYIYPRFKKYAILCNEISYNFPKFNLELELEGKTKLDKRHYIIGYLLGYRDNEIKGFYLRLHALRQLALKNIEPSKTKLDRMTLDKLINDEIKKINITKFNINYKELKTICNKWLKMALGKNSIYNDLFIKAEKDIKLLEI